MLGAFLVDLAVCLMAADIQFDGDEDVLEPQKAAPTICVTSKSHLSNSINDSNNNDNVKPELLPVAQQQESPL
jgi:hypothetical protein